MTLLQVVVTYGVFCEVIKASPVEKLFSEGGSAMNEFN